ncbi:valine--tRNA ligase-like [Neocloeon triangulifer]|uniref:valine--tRNA ligase-like n=1 Tax=Neocloeon triangulifer TaxID=2078957 RepID=UPI00286F274C|nr:valine--tRNA ligase-like [Neocloeon triangulifer]
MSPAMLHRSSVFWNKTKIHKIRRLYCDLANQKPPLASAYSKDVESGWYQKWEAEGQFKAPENPSSKNSFSLLLPPPNVTGILHLGHALTCSIQDALVRWNRMSGKDVVWIPGLDHAGIATQTVVERYLAAKNLGTRRELGREKFLQEAWKWKESKGDIIVEQIRNLGCSLDWSKQYFTMDEERSRAVIDAFVLLFEKGLIYRAESLVNWSCQLQSAIADIEVDWLQLEEPKWIKVPGYNKKIKFGELTHVALPIDGESGELVVATTRLETMLGDSGVAVHPQDERYSSFIGKFVKHPLRPEAKIPIIADEFVDRDFGTGVVKITPAHDATDFDVGKRHKLESINVFSSEGKILPFGGKFDGLKRFEAREEIRNQLESLGLIRGVSAVPNSKIPICSRSSDVVELMLKPQWFVDCKSMAEKAVKAVENGELVIDPPVFNKTWHAWLDDVRDWCISRQLWWGHQIPAYLCESEKSQVWVAAHSKEEAKKKSESILGTKEVKVSQDLDVLDTWFSSALLPFASLGWPSDPKRMENFYPLSLMETGHDILFFWVARMVMLGREITGKLPFHKILLHGIICDSHGRKMSKSLGNVINPEDIIHGTSLEELIARVVEGQRDASDEEVKKGVRAQEIAFPKGIPACGTDALRYTLCSHDAKVHYLNFDINECSVNRNFCNKIWQATKYVLNNSFNEATYLAPHELENLNLSLMDRWILSRLAHSIDTINTAFENKNLHESCSAIKEFIYTNFCDVYIEASKILLQEQHRSSATKHALLHCVQTYLRLLAPFMPFLSEELFQHLPGQQNSVHLNSYPSPAEWACLKNLEAESKSAVIIDTARLIRELKSLGKLSKPQTVALIETEDLALYQENLSVLEMLGQCSQITICNKIDSDVKSIRAPLSLKTLVHVVGQLQVQDLDKKLKKLRKEEESLVRTLTAKRFLEEASSDVKIAKNRKLEAVRLEIEKFSQHKSHAQSH